MTRRNVLWGLGLAAAGFGCGGMNPFLLPYMFSGGKSKVPAEFPLTPPPRKKEVKVIVFVSGKVGLHPDLAGVDRMLNAEIIQILDALFKENEQAAQVLKMPRIDAFKADNANWRSLHPYDIGKQLAEGADYIIDVEIVEMDLYKPGGRGRWLQGHATVSVAAYDLNKAVRDPAYKKDISFEFPQGQEEEVESRAQVSAFRLRFVRRIASDIARIFADSTFQPRMRNE